jgi:hypothetical protein
MSKFFTQIQSDLFATKQVVFVDSFFQNLDSKTLGKNKSEAFTLLLKCEQLGFTFNSDLLNVVSHATNSEMVKFWDWMTERNKDAFKQANYKPMYPNFPKQVIEASELELLVNAFMHYTGDVVGLRIIPSYKEKARKELKEEVTPMRMSVTTEDSIQESFMNLLLSNTSLSVSSKELMKNMFNYLLEKDASSLEDILIKNKIPQKENLAFMGAVVLQSSLDFNNSLAKQFQTPTDLIRLSAALNDGDTSLAKDTKIKNMSRPMRKAFAAKLENMLQTGDKSQFMENMFTYKEQWSRLAFAMHIGEYQSKCPLAFEALQKVRSNDKDESFNYKIEKLITSGNTVGASEQLCARPGIFGRMLNQVLSKSKDVAEQEKVLGNFKLAAESIATPVLLQIHAKFKYDNQNEKKIILPKGGLGKMFVRDLNAPKVEKVVKKKPVYNSYKVPEKAPEVKMESALAQALKNVLNIKDADKVMAEVKRIMPEITVAETEKVKELIKETAKVAVVQNYTKVSDELANKIASTIEITLIERFKSAPALGNVYIEDNLTLQNIPFAQRTASKALKTVPKGSRFVKESDKPIIRFFTWWNENGFDKNGKPVNVGLVDIDLSVGIFDSGYNLIKQCAYYDMRSSDYLTHSGDITSAPNGAAEYIDVNIDKMMKELPSAAYVGQLISSYTQQKYADMPECYSGWMEREQKQHGEIFEASTVQNKVDITCEATQVLTCLYDINRKEYIWADTPIKANLYYNNNLNSVKGAMAYAIEALVEMKKPNLYDLFEMHAKARGNIVTDKSKAETVFSLKEGVTPFDSEIIAAKFMADTYEILDSKKKLKP